MDTDLAYWFRLLNVGLMTLVFTVCLLRFARRGLDRGQRVRLVGLAIIALVLGSFSYDLRYADFSLRIPATTIGLSLLAYGIQMMPVSGQSICKKN